MSLGEQVRQIDLLSLVNTPLNFKGGKISKYLHVWKLLTSCPYVLNIVMGNFLIVHNLPPQESLPRPLRLNSVDDHALNLAMVEFLAQGIVEPCGHTAGSCFYSNVFPVLKEGDIARIILNLKDFNIHVDHNHFKMETLKDVLEAVFPGCYFATVDLKHAYYSVPVRCSDRDYLRFLWKGGSYRFTCLPQGYKDAPRLFTKLLKPVFALFRRLGMVTSCYLDDFIFMAPSPGVLNSHVAYAISLFDQLGLTISVSKSVVTPSQVVKFLGFEINSSLMDVSLTVKKQEGIRSLGSALLKASKVSVRMLASFIGRLVAAGPGVPYAPLRYKYLEILRNGALSRNRGNYDGFLVLDSRARECVSWWLKYDFSPRSLVPPAVHYSLTTDACKTGWGATMGDVTTRGHWDFDEVGHSTSLELKAVSLGLQALGKDIYNANIQVFSDCVTAVMCIEKFGSMKVHLLDMTEEIFAWAIPRGITLRAYHVKGCDNAQADKLSRHFNIHTEWALRQQVFDKLCTIFTIPHIDLFATRINAKLASYVSWHPDPGAMATNAFAIPWGVGVNYAFPPFSIIGRVLQKVLRERATVLAILPIWPTRMWFATALSLLADAPRLLPGRCLYLPQDPVEVHPLSGKLRLAAWMLSGDPSRIGAFRRSLRNSCSQPGALALGDSMDMLSGSGLTFVSEGVLIRFLPM